MRVCARAHYAHVCTEYVHRIHTFICFNRFTIQYRLPDPRLEKQTNAELVQAVKRIIALIPPYITVIVQWVPAQVGIDSNEHADFLAGEGAKFSASGRTNINMVAGVQNNLFLPRLPPHADA